MTAILSVSEVVSAYLYGANGVPENKADPALVRSQLGEGEFGAQLFVDLTQYMTVGPGRFATPEKFEILSFFFEQDIDIPFKENGYSEQELRQIINPQIPGSLAAIISLPQVLHRDSIDDLAERTLIWNTTGFEIADDTRFYIDESGERRIENFRIIPFPESENFDFDGGITSEVVEFLGLEAALDPNGIGRTVLISFTGSNDLPATSLTAEEFASFRTSEGIRPFPPPVSLYSDVFEIAEALFNEGVTRFVDEQNRVVVFGDPNPDTAPESYSLSDFVNSYHIGLALSNGRIFLGTEIAETVEGNSSVVTEYSDIIFGGGGADQLEGLSGNDVLVGGAGADRLFGGAGNDIIIFDAVDEVVSGGAGRDVAIAEGTTGINVQTASFDAEVIIGTDVGDVFVANDLPPPPLFGGLPTTPIRPDYTYLAGGGGADTFYAIQPSVVWGGSGADTFTFYGGGVLVVDANITEGGFAEFELSDLGFSRDFPLHLFSLVLINPTGADQLNLVSYDGETNQTLPLSIFAPEIPPVLEDPLHDYYNFNPALPNEYVWTQEVEFGFSTYTAQGHFLAQDLIPAAEIFDDDGDPVFTTIEDLSQSWFILGGEIDEFGLSGSGSSLFSIFQGSNEIDELIGDARDNIFAGGGGGDIIVGGEGEDTVSYGSSDEGVTVNLQSGTGSGGDADGDTISGVENVTGSGFSDIVTGSGIANFIYTAAGNDTIASGAGDDTLEGGEGNDTLSSGSGADRLLFMTGDGSDTVLDFDVAIDVLVLNGVELTPDDLPTGVDVSQVSADLVISYGAGDQITLLNTSLSDWIAGEIAPQTINGTNAGNVIQSGFGDDSIFAFGGDDTILYVGGDDVIVGNKKNYGFDTLDLSQFEADEVSFTVRVHDVLIATPDGTIELDYQARFGEGHSRSNIEQIVFSDETLDEAAITERALSDQHSQGDDIVGGTIQGDIINGSLGDDVIALGGGVDTFVYLGGNDVISGGSQSVNTGFDTLDLSQFSSDQVVFSNGGAFDVFIETSAGTIELDYQVRYSVGSSKSNIEQIVFSDLVLDEQGILDRIEVDTMLV